MFQDDGYVDVLVELGLTLLQAKTYLALAEVGSGGVEAVSRVSGVAGRDVCRVVSELQELGLVEKGSAEGVFVVVPLRKGVLGLLQQKVEKDVVLQEKACRLIDDLEDGFGGVGFVDVDAQFEVTSDLSVFHQKASASADGVRKSQDVILDLAGFRVLLAHGKQDVKDALGRGVRVRVITEEPENPEEDTFGFEHPLLTVKYVQAPVSISMMLYDDKEVHLRITEENVPSFWSNNPHILNLAKTYFDENWSKL